MSLPHHSDANATLVALIKPLATRPGFVPTRLPEVNVVSLSTYVASSPQILQDDATLPGISHNTNIHDFFKQKHIPVPADQPDGSDEDTAELPVNKP